MRNTAKTSSPIFDQGSEPRLLSIGHSRHDLAAFLALLRGASITAVADVRSSPYSQRFPQFSRPELEPALRAAGLVYVFLGDELGGRPQPAELYDDAGRVDYERVRGTDFFQRGLDRLIRGLDKHVVAMMCSEEDPLDCHRGLMIAPALVQRGIAVGHLRRDGSIESTAALEARLLRETGVGAGLVDGLFAATLSIEDRQALLAEAYRVRASRKAYRLRPEEAATDGPLHEEEERGE